jgi:hypothetical protein
LERNQSPLELTTNHQSAYPRSTSIHQESTRRRKTRPSRKACCKRHRNRPGTPRLDQRHFQHFRRLHCRRKLPLPRLLHPRRQDHLNFRPHPNLPRACRRLRPARKQVLRNLVAQGTSVSRRLLARWRRAFCCCVEVDVERRR